jgi:hypothetical protein
LDNLSLEFDKNAIQTTEIGKILEVKKMKTKRKKQATVTTIAILVFVLFAINSALAEKMLSTSMPENAIVEMVERDQTSSYIDNHVNKGETSEAKNVKNTCDFRSENSVGGQIALITPYEFLSGDYFNMFAKYFNLLSC